MPRRARHDGLFDDGLPPPTPHHGHRAETTRPSEPAPPSVDDGADDAGSSVSRRSRRSSLVDVASSILATPNITLAQATRLAESARRGGLSRSEVASTVARQTTGPSRGLTAPSVAASEATRAFVPSGVAPRRAPQQAAATVADRGPRADANTEATPYVIINGFHCDVSSLRVIPDIMFGPRVLLQDLHTGRIHLPNGYDGSVVLRHGRLYRTVILRGPMGEATSAGVFDANGRQVPRPWVLDTVSAAYRAASAAFYDAVPTLAEHARQVEASGGDPAEAMRTHPITVATERFTAFARRNDEFRRCAMGRLNPATFGPAPPDAEPPVHRDNRKPDAADDDDDDDDDEPYDLGAAWAVHALGRSRTRLHAFNVFCQEHPTTSFAALSQRFKALPRAERAKYEQLADERNAAAGDLPLYANAPALDDAVGAELSGAPATDADVGGSVRDARSASVVPSEVASSVARQQRAEERTRRRNVAHAAEAASQLAATTQRSQAAPLSAVRHAHTPGWGSMTATPVNMGGGMSAGLAGSLYDTARHGTPGGGTAPRLTPTSYGAMLFPSQPLDASQNDGDALF